MKTKNDSGKSLLLPRLIVASLLLLSLLAISFYGGTVSYSFFFAVLLLPISCLVYLLIVLWRFRIYQEIGSRTLVSGQPGSYFFTLQNEDRITFSSVRVRFYSDFSEIETLPEQPEYELLPGDRYTYETRIICKYRGEYEVGVRDVVLTDFIGLFRIRYRFPGVIRAQVLPKIVELSAIRALENLSAKLQLEKKDASGMPDAVLREYVPGDPVKLISWRQSARAMKPEVRELIREERRGFAVVLDCFRSDEEGPEGYLPAENKLLEIVLAIAFYASAHGLPCRVLRNNSLSVSAIQSAEDFRRFYEESAAVSFGRAEKPEDYLSDPAVLRKMENPQAVFIAVRFLSLPLLAAVSRLQEQGLFVIVYAVGDAALPAEILPALNGRFSVTPVTPEDDLTEVL